MGGGRTCGRHDVPASQVQKSVGAVVSRWVDWLTRAAKMPDQLCSGLIDGCENGFESGCAGNFRQTCEVIVIAISSPCSCDGDCDQLMVGCRKGVEGVALGWGVADPHVNHPFQQELRQGNGVSGCRAGEADRDPAAEGPRCWDDRAGRFDANRFQPGNPKELVQSS